MAVGITAVLRMMGVPIPVIVPVVIAAVMYMRFRNVAVFIIARAVCHGVPRTPAMMAAPAAMGESRRAANEERRAGDRYC